MGSAMGSEWALPWARNGSVLSKQMSPNGKEREGKFRASHNSQRHQVVGDQNNAKLITFPPPVHICIDLAHGVLVFTLKHFP